MAIHLLGIVRARDVARWETGRSDMPLRWVVAGELAGAVVGPQASAPDPVELARVQAAIHQRAALLPVQSGVALPDDAAVRRLLEARREEFASSLDRVEGACEMGLRIVLPHLRGPHFVPASALPQAGEGLRADRAGAGRHGSRPVSPGDYLVSRRDYYAQRDRRNQRTGSATTAYVEALQGSWREWHPLPDAPPGIVRMAFLVEGIRLPEFHVRFQEVRQARADERSVLLGPWPPYSFV